MVFVSKFRGWPRHGFRLTFLPQMIEFLIYIKYIHIHVCILYTYNIYMTYIYKDFIKSPTEMKAQINHSIKFKDYTHIINRNQNIFTEEQSAVIGKVLENMSWT